MALLNREQWPVAANDSGRIPDSRGWHWLICPWARAAGWVLPERPGEPQAAFVDHVFGQNFILSI